MIKSFEELNSEELSYVKNVVRKYLQDCDQDDILADERINMINELLKKNEKDIKKRKRKVEYISTGQEDNFIFFFGMICSACVFGFISDDLVEALMLFFAGTISSYIINSILKVIKKEDKRNIYKDLGDLDNLLDENQILKSTKQKLLNYKSYQKELKNFVND